MALPTTPTLTAASTASGKTQNTSMCFIVLAFGRPDHDPPRFQIQHRNVLKRERNIEVLDTFPTYHENFVGGGLESVLDDADALPGSVHGGQSDEVRHVELAFFRRVELCAVEKKLFAFQGGRVFPAPYTFYVDQNPLRGFSRG